jgi:DMSO reductase anchor subunit
MRPSFSIIFFTVLSGAGYGLLFLAALGIAFGGTVGGRALAMLVAGGVLASVGLLASLGHLGKPLRAWRALSQWRSSWLSREGVASLATYLPLLCLLSAGLLPALHAAAATLRIAAAALCLGATATVVCTANIYASLKPVRAWHDPHVVAGYLLIGLHTGMAWWLAFAAGSPWPAWLLDVLLLAPAGAVLKWRYWRSIDAAPAMPTPSAATGLAGRVVSLEAPHTEENYLTREMGFVLARKHARRLRRIVVVLFLLAPACAFALWLVLGWPAALAGLLAAMLAAFVERWLFFAEARHAVMAYYAR